MKLLTDELKAKLRENNKRRGENHIPVVKFFYPAGAATWIITEMEDDEDTLFGLCDLGFGEPELGYVSLSEIEGANKKMHIPVERDLHWNPTKPISSNRRRLRALSQTRDLDEHVDVQRNSGCEDSNCSASDGAVSRARPLLVGPSVGDKRGRAHDLALSHPRNAISKTHRLIKDARCAIGLLTILAQER